MVNGLATAGHVRLIKWLQFHIVFEGEQHNMSLNKQYTSMIVIRPVQQCQSCKIADQGSPAQVVDGCLDRTNQFAIANAVATLIGPHGPVMDPLLPHGPVMVSHYCPNKPLLYQSRSLRLMNIALSLTTLQLCNPHEPLVYMPHQMQRPAD